MIIKECPSATEFYFRIKPPKTLFTPPAGDQTFQAEDKTGPILMSRSSKIQFHPGLPLGVCFFPDPDPDLLMGKIKGHDEAQQHQAGPDPDKPDLANDSFIAFSPEQIKSSTGNTGAFDPTKAAVTAGLGGVALREALKSPRTMTDEEILDELNGGKQ